MYESMIRSVDNSIEDKRSIDPVF